MESAKKEQDRMNIFQEAQFREAMRSLAEAKPLSKSRQAAAAWSAILSESPKSPREYLLREIANGVRLSRQDAIRYVFGNRLSKTERRSYLAPSGQAFDLFLMGCMYDFYGEYHWQDVRTWEDELHEVISGVSSRAEARSILITAYLDTHGPFYRTKPTENFNINPAF